ncbi:geranylgeranyl reductase family protein [Corynebacterium sp. H78]|uniref:geranylgeranyl reductase family protein n=1 Tax=Corynebacterium sp. H78 TaxID=3133417 RepID=UPI0030979D52
MCSSASIPPLSVDVLVVGAGPTGAAAAIHAVDAGFSVLLVDSQTFPRDKTCGDGLTPRAIAELDRLGLAEGVLERTRNNGLKLHGFGGSITAPWPEGPFPTAGSAVPRLLFDDLLVQHARSLGATVCDGFAVSSVTHDVGRAVSGVTLRSSEGTTHEVKVRWLLVADGVRSPVGKMLGRTWHRDNVFGVAARSYCTSSSEDPEKTQWIHSHLELRDDEGTVHPGYGWIFPLGEIDGVQQMNVGCGALATSKRPAKVNTKKLLRHYASQVSEEWQLGTPTKVTSALLPMGGSVSHVAGPNWALLGDAAALVNPLNGEGIDYGMESSRLAVELISSLVNNRDGLTYAWPALLRREFGEGFSLARRLAESLTLDWFLPTVGPLTIGAPWGNSVMGVAARLMGNLVTESDRDVVAKLWRAAGKASIAADSRKPWA